MIAPIESYRRELKDDGHSVVAEASLLGKPPIEQPFGSGAADSGGIADTAKRLVGNHPAAAVTMAVTLGLIVGWIVKRKLNG